MNNHIQPFNFDNALVRTVILDNGEPAFVARDVAEVLGYANTKDAVARHCKGVVNHYPLQTNGGVQQVRVISESDVMRLIVSSKLPAAERFERWVFEEVLPSIRKTGSYSTQPEPKLANNPLELMALSLQALQEQQAQINEVRQDVQAINQKIAEAPINGVQVGHIYRLGQRLGRLVGTYSRGWRMFNDRFGLASYRDLPAGKYEEAVRFLELQIMSYEGDHLLEVSA